MRSRIGPHHLGPLTAVAAAVTIAMFLLMASGMSRVPEVANVYVVLPGAVLAATCRGQWRRLYRWAAIWLLAFLVNPGASMAFVVVAQTWALYHQLVLEDAWADRRRRGPVPDAVRT